MKTPATLAITLAIVSSMSCSGLKPEFRETATLLGGKLRDAVQDLDVKGLVRDAACSVYVKNGRASAEAAFEHDWPTFAPLFETPPDPAADLQWCKDTLAANGVQLVTRLDDTSSASAVCVAVLLPKDFEQRGVKYQAALCLHELSHSLGQKREGCKEWVADYVKVSGRLAKEGVAYALQDAAYARYGISEAAILKISTRRAERFPKKYLLEHVVDGKCVEDYFAAIRQALQERTGV